MKDIILHSKKITAHVNAFGAELKGLEMDGVEYLYDGDPLYYGRTSPTLFPIIGRFLSDTYYEGNRAYFMKLNGFAMERNFTVEKLAENSVTFLLESDGRTRAEYPYEFSLRVQYELNDNRMNISYRIENKGNNKMPFCIGCHTAYRWPLFENEDPNDYELRFEKEEDIASFNPFNWKDPGFVKGTKRPLSHDLFSNYTRSMTDLRSEWVEFGNPANGHAVRIHRSEMPFLAMWTLPDENARLVCLEPCTSVHAGAATTLADRNGAIVLQPGELSEKHFSIELF